jgi:Domain of unknown function (DUF4333)
MARLRCASMSQPARAPRIARCGLTGASPAVAALVGAALIAGCGSSKPATTSHGKTNLDTARVARSIEQSIATQRHLNSSVVCPPAIPQEKGRTFDCIATTRTIKKPVKVSKTRFVATVQNNNGYVTYEGK